VGACPGLGEVWQRERVDDDEAPLPYAIAAALAHSVVRRHAEGDRECLSSLFRDLEEMLASEGIALEDKNLLVVGFIEDLQGAIGWAGVDAKPLYALLGPCRGRRGTIS
jgi:hypothetical protein